jgi:hypothetical protein
MARLLEALDTTHIAEDYALPEDQEPVAIELIKQSVIALVLGPAPPGSALPKPLSETQMAAVQVAYNDIRESGGGELWSLSVAVVLANACMAWYTDYPEYTVSIATHAIEEICPNAGEAYRVRAFGYISLGQYDLARSDLRHALELDPSLDGAKEPLSAISKLT